MISSKKDIWLGYFKRSFFLKKEIIIAKEPSFRNLLVYLFWFKSKKSVCRKYVSSYDQVLMSNAMAKHELLWVSRSQNDTFSATSIGLSGTQWGQLRSVRVQWGLAELSVNQWGLIGINASQRGSLVLSGHSVEHIRDHWGSTEVSGI